MALYITLEHVAKHDELRTLELADIGIKIIRFTNEEVLTDVSKVLRLLEEEIT